MESTATSEAGSDASSNTHRKISRGWDTPTDKSGHSVHSLLSHAMDALSDKGLSMANDSGPDYSSEEEDLAQAQEDSRGRSQTRTFLCKDLLDIVLEYMSHNAELTLSEIGLSGSDKEGQAKKFDYLTVEALASHKDSQMKHAGTRPNLQTFISGLSYSPGTMQLDGKDSMEDLTYFSHSPGGSGGGGDRGSPRPPSTSSQSSLPPRPPSSSSTSSAVVPHVLPLVGTRDEYQLWPAEEDGTVMDDLPAFNMTSNVISTGLNDFVVVRRQGDTTMMHVRIAERERDETRKGEEEKMFGKCNVRRSASNSAVSNAIAITPSQSNNLEGEDLDMGSRHRNQGQERGEVASASSSNSSYIFNPSVKGSSPTEDDHPDHNLGCHRSAAGTTSATRTFASYLGWSSSSFATKGNVDAGEDNTSGNNIRNDDSNMEGEQVAGASGLYQVDSEQKEEQRSLPPEFDEETKTRYFDRRNMRNVSRRSMSITEGYDWVARTDEDINSHIKSGGGGGAVVVMVRKPLNANVVEEWKCIKKVVITARGADAEDPETAKAAYKALMRDNESCELRTRGDGIAINVRKDAASLEKTGLETDSGDISEEQSLTSLHSHDEGIYSLNDGGDICLASASVDMLDDGEVFGMSME